MYGINLEQYLETLEELPKEMQNKFLQMRDYDKKVVDTLRYIEELSQTFLNDYNQLNSSQKTDVQKNISKRYKKCEEWSDVKIQIATQTYEMIDKHIRRLDAELAKFEAKLKHKAAIIAAASNSQEFPTPSSIGGKKAHISYDANLHSPKTEVKKKGNVKQTPKRSNIHLDEETPRMDIKGKKNRSLKLNEANVSKNIMTTHGKTDLMLANEIQQTDSSNIASTSMSKFSAFSHPSHILDMPVDPNEPTYCVCHQVSYGEMIGCDNPDCLIEWFHFGCVNLTHKPKGKWYCPACAPNFSSNKSTSSSTKRTKT